MRITFLGTSAANAFPEAFCSCDNCKEARKLGGKSLRKRSSILINDDLIIDLGPDIMTSSQIHNCSLVNVKYCLQTHFHSDHLDLSHLLSRSAEYGTISNSCLHFYASIETLERADETFKRDLEGYSLLSVKAERRLNIKIHPIKPLTPFFVGGYKVLAFPANHAPNLGAMLYAVELEGKKVFYGTDTSIITETTWQAFQEYNVCFDIVILDHTYGPNQECTDHLNAHQVIEHIRRMNEERLLKPESRSIATHIAHEGNPAHQKLSEFAKQNGYEVAYDGLVIEI